MKLSPRMIQSMEILQLSAMALEERIEQALEENPVLELEEKLGDPVTPRQASEADQEKPLVLADKSGQDSAPDFERADELQEQYGEQWAQNTQESAEYRPTSQRDFGDRDAKMDAMASAPSRSAPMSQQLLDQWRFVEADGPIHRAGECLIEFIDDDGYLRTPIDQIMRQGPVGSTHQDFETALTLMQRTLEPTGIAARNLAECLMLQLNALIEQEGSSPELVTARMLVKDHIKNIELNRLIKIAEKTGLHIDAIKSGLAALRRLDPRPGQRLAAPRDQTVNPDVIIAYDSSKDAYIAALARGRTPSLRISPIYTALAQDREQDKATRQYLNQNVSNARWFIDALQQRQTTLLRVVNVVIDAQRDFLDHGPQHLRPLPMIHVADELGIHVGTVSRAVADKYIQTPRGIYPLRMFFSGGTESASGQEMSWAAVQAKLKEIVDAEDACRPLSDDELVAKLKEAGLEIARRTVAKYRQQLNIPTARQRKKF